MPNPSGKCAFCDGSKITKSHIWPEWSQKIVPSLASSYEIEMNHHSTFAPNFKRSTPYSKIQKGAVAKRRPYNTCGKCNAGWMREIEETVMASLPALLRGEHLLLDTTTQKLLATFLCLVSMRIYLAPACRTWPTACRGPRRS